jgi:hypothetical protein
VGDLRGEVLPSCANPAVQGLQLGAGGPAPIRTRPASLAGKPLLPTGGPVPVRQEWRTCGRETGRRW